MKDNKKNINKKLIEKMILENGTYEVMLICKCENVEFVWNEENYICTECFHIIPDNLNDYLT